MNTKTMPINESRAAAAFSKQSKLFDDIYSGNTIVQYKRERVRNVLQQYLLPNSHVLELNSGTGEDAVWLAQQGHHVHATDISTGMQQVLTDKVKVHGLESLVDTELCSFTELNTLNEKGPYDLIFSNFAGLNCTGELNKVLHSFDGLLKPNGTIVLVILPSFCLWEALMMFKGNFKTAFRRFFSKNGVKARVEDTYFTCWYYNPSYIIKELKSSFNLLGVEGLCTIVPPSYIEHFAERHATVYAYLKKKEDKLKRRWPWKFIGDYYVVSMQKK